MNWCYDSLYMRGDKQDIENVYEILKAADWNAFQAKEISDLCFFSDPKIDANAVIGFDTAYGPPVEYLAKIAADFPQIRFRLTFMEPLSNYCGACEFVGGELVSVESDTCGRELYIEDVEC